MAWDYFDPLELVWCVEVCTVRVGFFDCLAFLFCCVVDDDSGWGYCSEVSFEFVVWLEFDREFFSIPAEDVDSGHDQYPWWGLGDRLSVPFPSLLQSLDSS